MADDTDSNNTKKHNSPPLNLEVRSGTVFAEAPYHLRESFIEWIKQTNEPEAFWPLCTERLSKREPYILIHKFEVEYLQRPNGEYIPCANCRPGSGKFLKGRLIYAVRLKKLYLIGNECADKRTNRAANKEFDRRIKVERATDALLRSLPLVPVKIALLKKMVPAATGADRLIAELRKTTRPLMALLVPMNKTHGEVLVAIDPSKASMGKSKGAFEPVASIGGSKEAFRGRLHYERELRVRPEPL